MLSLIALKPLRIKGRLTVKAMSSFIAQQLEHLDIADEIQIDEYTATHKAVSGYLKKANAQFEVELGKPLDVTYLTFHIFCTTGNSLTLTLAKDANLEDLQRIVKTLTNHIHNLPLILV